MKGRSEDLGLKEDQGPGEAGPDPEAQKFLLVIETMRESGAYDWADDTLTRIYDWVVEHGRISEGQVKAIRNIRDARARAAEELNIEDQ